MLPSVVIKILVNYSCSIQQSPVEMWLTFSIFIVMRFIHVLGACVARLAFEREDQDSVFFLFR